MGHLVSRRMKQSACLCFTCDGAFSIDIGLELVCVAGSIYWAGSLNNLQLALKG